jgi:hypothetical protein
MLFVSLQKNVKILSEYHFSSIVVSSDADISQYAQGAYSAGIFYFGLTPSGTNGSCIASLDTTANPAVFTLLACSASQPVPNQPASLALGDGVLLVSDPNKVRLVFHHLHEMAQIADAPDWPRRPPWQSRPRRLHYQPRGSTTFITHFH